MKHWAGRHASLIGASLLTLPPLRADETATPAKPAKRSRRRRRHQVRSHRPDGHRAGRQSAGRRRRARLHAGLRRCGQELEGASPTPVTRTLTGIAFKDAKVGRRRGPRRLGVRTDDGGDDLDAGAARRRPDRIRCSASRTSAAIISSPTARSACISIRVDAGKTWQKRMVAVRGLRPAHLAGAAGRQLAAAGRPSPARSRVPTTAARRGRRSPRRTRARTSARSRPRTARCWSSACAATSTARPTSARPGRRSPLDTTASLMPGRQLADGRVLLVGNSGPARREQRRRPDARPALGAGADGLRRAGGGPAGRSCWSGETGVTLLDPAWLEPITAPAAAQ